MASNKAKSAKRKTMSSFRHAVFALRGAAMFNDEPRFKRERRKGGGNWRCWNDYQLLAVAAKEARRNDYLLKIGAF